MREAMAAPYDLLKRYLYLTLTSRFRPPMGRDHAHWIREPLDAAAMGEAVRSLIGRHDFAAFGNAGSKRRTTVRTVPETSSSSPTTWSPGSSR